ncbi:hypothetical protein L6V77_06500 [Myxococcota bacterium]|jgi:hypothetical protein|nr:hypothetical protein [Myxococcota bacterium]
MESNDPLVDEVRAIRDRIAGELDYDIERLGKEMQTREGQSGRPVVRLSPRRIEQAEGMTNATLPARKSA